MISVNTHNYDGELGKIYHELKIYDDNNLIPPLEWNLVINEIEIKLEEYLNRNPSDQNVKKWWEVLKSDDKNNYDDANKIHIHELLCRLWRFVRHYDEGALNIFFEQISDISNGSCSQGRSTRLAQFYTVH